MAGILIASMAVSRIVAAVACDNVAVGAEATATGNHYPDCTPNGAVDGTEASGCGWSAPGPQDLTIDLRETREIDRVWVRPYVGSTSFFYLGEWTLTHSLDNATFNDFTDVQKLEGDGDLASPGIRITNGDPGTGANEPTYEQYGFSVGATQLRYVRLSVVVGDADNDSNVDELKLCATTGSDEDFHGAQAAGCAPGQYFDLVEEVCRTPAAPGCSASAARVGPVAALLIAAGRRRRRSRSRLGSSRRSAP
jgi:hypothetical protein